MFSELRPASEPTTSVRIRSNVIRVRINLLRRMHATPPGECGAKRVGRRGSMTTGSRAADRGHWHLCLWDRIWTRNNLAMDWLFSQQVRGTKDQRVWTWSRTAIAYSVYDLMVALFYLPDTLLKRPSRPFLYYLHPASLTLVTWYSYWETK